MKTALSIIFYTIIFALLGALAIAFAFHLIDLTDLIMRIGFLYEDTRMRLITGLSGVLLILLSFAASQVISGKIQREKTIAFSNPNGQVTITLSAVEDLIRRLANQLTEIRDAKAVVKATKKGIDIRMRVVLRSETNIPDFTAQLQDLISGKIQEVFGIDEPITVKIHVAKIVTGEERSKKKAEKSPLPNEEIQIPYQGIKI
ncbi:MAG TPA: alkaline shock response membrane anchor protein AmaP [Candidatus Omnitrophica bacterium]|nr:alkaline shock response membrane anchor protein AmaP [Candidatus Omnitrophota bacterium]